eukprot:TRINITY_DN5043_c0_g1_i1.p1 TRINITY_DN5043_c0_g1~~TRINITY_DN5043_c0_g1_i1.p1  ORF type:complete len:238 (-),score=76.51 TRINITY_DN5043_c0_g1_i1:396-1109(-)
MLHGGMFRLCRLVKSGRVPCGCSGASVQARWLATEAADQEGTKAAQSDAEGAESGSGSDLDMSAYEGPLSDSELFSDGEGQSTAVAPYEHQAVEESSYSGAGVAQRREQPTAQRSIESLLGEMDLSSSSAGGPLHRQFKHIDEEELYDYGLGDEVTGPPKVRPGIPNPFGERVPGTRKRVNARVWRAPKDSPEWKMATEFLKEAFLEDWLEEDMEFESPFEIPERPGPRLAARKELA